MVVPFGAPPHNRRAHALPFRGKGRGVASGMFCNADVDAFLSGVAPSALARQRLHQVARVFALCGPVGTPLGIPGADGRWEPLPDADLWRTRAAQRGHHHGPLLATLPHSNPAPALLCWGTDARSVALGDSGDPAVARTVNSKAFSQRKAADHGLEPGMFQHARVVDRVTALQEHLAEVPEPVAAQWTLKPLWGFAGGGRTAGSGRTLAPGTRRALEARLALDGAVVFEPWVTRVSDHSTQLWVGGPTDVRVVFQGTLLNTPGGRYLGNVDVAPGSPQAAHHAALAAAATQSGRWLAEAGYRGPAGVDAFVYRDALRGGAHTLRPVVEINARFTLGFVAGVVVRMAREYGSVAPRANVRFTLADDDDHRTDGYRLEPEDAA